MRLNLTYLNFYCFFRQSLQIIFDVKAKEIHSIIHTTLEGKEKNIVV
jgi:hypothetical protein